MARKRLKKKYIVWFLLVISIILALGVIYFWRHRTPVSGKSQLASVLKKVGQHIVLPSGEVPTLATIKDTKKLVDPYLKKSAQTGDEVLLYYNAKEVILYRPSLNRVINIYPLILDPSEAQAKDAKILIRSGNDMSETAELIRQKLSNAYSGIVLSGIEPATKQAYPETIIIDLTDGTKYDFVSSMMKLLHAKRGILPNGEPKPDNTDILIITGIQ